MSLYGDEITLHILHPKTAEIIKSFNPSNATFSEGISADGSWSATVDESIYPILPQLDEIPHQIAFTSIASGTEQVLFMGWLHKVKVPECTASGAGCEWWVKRQPIDANFVGVSSQTAASAVRDLYNTYANKSTSPDNYVPLVVTSTTPPFSNHVILKSDRTNCTTL